MSDSIQSSMVKIYRPKKISNNSSQSSSKSDLLKKNQQAIDDKVKLMPKEYGGRTADKGLEATRYGDWELKGRCVDF